MSHNLYKLLEKLDEKNIWFCLQVQWPQKFYNLGVYSPDQVKVNMHYETRPELELALSVMYGHLLEEPKIPAGFPMP